MNIIQMMASTSESVGPIADIRLQLNCLGSLRATKPIAWTSIFPYSLMRRYPFYAGLLIAILIFSEFLSGMIWSRVSDKIGRKRCLLIGGSVCSMITSGWLRILHSIASAAASRAFGGLLNPNTGLVPACTVEVARKDGQRGLWNMYDTWTASGYSTQKPCLDLIHTSNLIGQVLGGMLAEPGKNYPSVFPPGSIWTTHPFLLPNPVVASLQLFALIFTSLFLEETHPELREIPD
ncbi:hypothetical protein QC761_0081110 [Podospora bellae-mahoneyi]|uniref:Major facilitator superfamily (MFS) profile domain-containing protein n=1 Tax=Podospora bellae-mahoneyi TaxID=2093777 RepID=A0ABR0FGJ1_9PEZI|nr:hypothetical protein QC761_0081110 [Podospora bellae-mahoneyi]